MIALAWLAALAHLVVAAVELPALWGRPGRRGEFWAVITLLLLGGAFAVMVTLGYRPVSVWKLIEAVFRPIGDPLLRPKGG